MSLFTGKNAVVTGGTRGIGRAICERLLREGASVALCGRKPENVRAAVEALRPLGNVVGYPADVTDAQQVADFFGSVDRDLGELHILVNNAGQGVFRKVGEMSPEDWRRNIDLNLNGPFYCSREALKRFGARGGYIVNISSLAGKNAFSGGAGYNAAKSGLNLFSEAMMLDHRHDNVRVSYIMPGSVNTDFSGGPADRSGDNSWMIAPEDVADAVSFVLGMPARTTVSRIEIRPSRPRK